MKKKKTIKKIFILGGWLLVISGMATLLIAANGKQKEHVCREIRVGISGNEGQFYVEKDDVLSLIEKSAGGSVLQKSVSKIRLAALEKSLEKNPWIRNAELYFDQRNVLHVLVEEREPVARVFTTAGRSFYIDSSGSAMPLIDKMSIRVPVVTGFTDARRFNAADSALLQQVKNVAMYVFTNPFWNAQVGQIDITKEGKFELIPVVGDHVIKLGEGTHVEEKLDRLFVFYKQVMSKVGFSKYAALNLEFDGQVVAVRKEPTSPVDSIQLKKNIEELMNKASMQNIDEDMLPAKTVVMSKADSMAMKAAQANTVSANANPNPIASDKTDQNTAKKNQPKTIPKKSVEKPNQKEKPNKRVPKAVMPSARGK